MDRFSCLSYLLYQVDHPYVKEKAIEMVCGEISLSEAMQDKVLRVYIKKAELILKDEAPKTEEVCAFVEKYLYS